MVQMQAKDFAASLRFYLSLCHYFKCELIYGKRQSEKKRKQTVVYVELGNNFTVHTPQMHRHTILLTSTVCIVWLAGAFLPPLARSVSSTVKRCLQQTFFLLYIRMYNRFYLVETVFFRMTFLSFALRSSFWHFTRLSMNLVRNTVFLCHLKTIKNTFIPTDIALFLSYTICAAAAVVVAAPDNFSIQICCELLVMMQCE